MKLHDWIHSYWIKIRWKPFSVFLIQTTADNKILSNIQKSKCSKHVIGLFSNFTSCTWSIWPTIQQLVVVLELDSAVLYNVNKLRNSRKFLCTHTNTQRRCLQCTFSEIYPFTKPTRYKNVDHNTGAVT